MQMVSALFWDITQRRVVILYRHFETTYRSILKVELICCPETLVQNYHAMLHNIPEEHRYQTVMGLGLGIHTEVFGKTI